MDPDIGRDAPQGNTSILEISRRDILRRGAVVGVSAAAIWSVPMIESVSASTTHGSPADDGGGNGQPQRTCVTGSVDLSPWVPIQLYQGTICEAFVQSSKFKPLEQICVTLRFTSSDPLSPGNELTIAPLNVSIQNTTSSQQTERTVCINAPFDREDYFGLGRELFTIYMNRGHAKLRGIDVLLCGIPG